MTPHNTKIFQVEQKQMCIGLSGCLFGKRKLKSSGIGTALQIRAGRRSITASLRPLTAHIYHVMIIMTGGFSVKSFLSLFPRKSFEQS